jgi:hypothetical protein
MCTNISIIDIVINPLFEGVAGHDRLNLQKKFGGDERFKLTEDFVSDEEESRQEDTTSSDDDEITKSLEEERASQFDILKGMFGDDMKPERLNLKKYVINQYLLFGIYEFKLILHMTGKNLNGKI